MVTAFPARGQKSPDFWDEQLKDYIDEADATKASVNSVEALAAQLPDKADDASVVKTTGAQDVAGVKTFSSAPVVPDGSFSQAKVVNLTADLGGKEPARTTVSQVEAEAGTATTVRGWTAQRVAQAVGAYIAANTPSILTTLGITAFAQSLLNDPDAATMRATLGLSPAPVRFSAETPTTGTTGTDRAAAARTITEARMRVGTAPAGSALVVVVQHWNGSTWATVTTLTIADGSTTEHAVTGLSQAQVAGNMIRLSVTSVGSTTPATDVVVDVVTT